MFFCCVFKAWSVVGGCLLLFAVCNRAFLPSFCRALNGGDCVDLLKLYGCF